MPTRSGACCGLVEALHGLCLATGPGFGHTLHGLSKTENVMHAGSDCSTLQIPCIDLGAFTEEEAR